MKSKVYRPHGIPSWEERYRAHANAVLRRRITIGLLWLLGLILFGLVVARVAHARDDGRFANSPLKPWFDKLASGKGLCCSFADGVKIEDPDVDNQGPDSRFRVRLDGKWLVVPDDALITEPNKFGPAVVWPYQDANGMTQIRCFIPGSGA